MTYRNIGGRNQPKIENSGLHVVCALERAVCCCAMRNIQMIVRMPVTNVTTPPNELHGVDRSESPTGSRRRSISPARKSAASRPPPMPTDRMVAEHRDQSRRWRSRTTIGLGQPADSPGRHVGVGLDWYAT
jgi:hypothetical protein